MLPLQIETSHLTIASRTTLAPVTKAPLVRSPLPLLPAFGPGRAPSLNSAPPSYPPRSLASLTPTFHPPPHPRAQYHPHLTLHRSTNAGKSLLAKLSVEPALPMAAYATTEGDVDGEGLARWVAGALEGK